MIVYHGTSEQIVGKLSYSRIGKNGTSKGYGFYFTDSRHEAENYAVKESVSGLVYSASFHGSKELSLFKRTISRGQLTRFYTAIEDLILLNYESVQEAVNEDNELDTDSDIINGLIQSVSNVERVLTTLHKMLGYDYSMDPLENKIHYVALVPDVYDLIIAYVHDRQPVNQTQEFKALGSMRK